MQEKYKRIIPLLLIVIAAAIVLMLTSCGHKSLKGELVNQYSDKGRTNSYENIENFQNYSYYSELCQTKEEAGAIVPALALSNQEIVYATTSGKILMIMNNEIAWEKSLGVNTVVSASLCADKEQNIYAVSNIGYIYSYSFEGKLRWKKSISDSIDILTVPCDLLAMDSGILAGMSNGILCKFDFDGKLLWKIDFKKSINKTLVALGEYPIVTISSENDSDTLTMLNPNGSTKWKIASGTRLIKYPLASSNTIYCTGMRYVGDNALSEIIAYDTLGTIKWRKELSFVPRYISVSNSDEVYANVFQSGIGEQISAIFKMDNTGKIIWKKYFNFTIPTPVLISNYSIAFLGVTNNTVGLYFVNKNNGIIENIQSFSNELPIIHSPTVRPDGVISFAYYQNIGFLRVDEPWINKILPW